MGTVTRNRRGETELLIILYESGLSTVEPSWGTATVSCGRIRWWSTGTLYMLSKRKNKEAYAGNGWVSTWVDAACRRLRYIGSNKYKYVRNKLLMMSFCPMPAASTTASDPPPPPPDPHLQVWEDRKESTNLYFRCPVPSRHWVAKTTSLKWNGRGLSERKANEPGIVLAVKEGKSRLRTQIPSRVTGFVVRLGVGIGSGFFRKESCVGALSLDTEEEHPKPKPFFRFEGGDYGLRDSWNKPTRVEGLDGVRVRATFASDVASMAIDDNGSLWVWGKSKRGQLGLGKGIMEAWSPTKVEALAGEKIVKVSLGWGHALAQTADGKLFGWGYAAIGRLGNVGKALEDSDLANTISPPSPKKSCSIQQDAENLVLHQIERGKHMPLIWNPCLVQEFHGHEVIDVACGLDHSIVLRGEFHLNHQSV
ncbi:hypothetical protein H6P81_008892 [Aristolochia fimbriata]|uniref:Uncharacterized protein n=1 Tax=Aristolochia fimbriata TaxID=158543 RepID=A0AAV7EJA3_ARIFI|nr:hypothetical protein H6P81_008892 [Aristolochia fimbriata]